MRRVHSSPHRGSVTVSEANDARAFIEREGLGDAVKRGAMAAPPLPPEAARLLRANGFPLRGKVPQAPKEAA
jgi:hypothetical protein